MLGARSLTVALAISLALTAGSRFVVLVDSFVIVDPAPRTEDADTFCRYQSSKQVSPNILLLTQRYHYQPTNEPARGFLLFAKKKQPATVERKPDESKVNYLRIVSPLNPYMVRMHKLRARSVVSPVMAVGGAHGSCYNRSLTRQWFVYMFLFIYGVDFAKQW
jgi:hypothetical protein